jgi:hypothetical protein
MEDDEFRGVDKPEALDIGASPKTTRCNDFAVILFDH